MRPVHPPGEEKRDDGKNFATGADSHNQMPVASEDEMRYFE